LLLLVPRFARHKKRKTLRRVLLCDGVEQCAARQRPVRHTSPHSLACGRAGQTGANRGKPFLTLATRDFARAWHRVALRGTRVDFVWGKWALGSIQRKTFRKLCSRCISSGLKF
jgi:hypothetical protein